MAEITAGALLCQSQYRANISFWDSPRDFNCSAVTERPSFRSDKKRPSMVAVSF